MCVCQHEEINTITRNEITADKRVVAVQRNISKTKVGISNLGLVFQMINDHCIRILGDSRNISTFSAGQRLC